VLDLLATYPLVYLGTPYTKYADGIEAAFVDASRLAAVLLRAGVRVYCPISHTHPIAVHGRIDPLDHAIWLPFDRAMMDASAAMVVGMLPGWGDSFGVQHEIDVFTAAGKPVHYLDPVDVGVTCIQ